MCPTGSIVDTLNMFDERKSYADNVVPCREGCPAHVDIPRYLALYRRGKLNLDGLITHRFPLDKINEALDVVRGGEAGRVMLTMT